MTDEVIEKTEGGKIKRTVKDKLYFIVFGKYPEQKEEDEEDYEGEEYEEDIIEEEDTKEEDTEEDTSKKKNPKKTVKKKKKTKKSNQEEQEEEQEEKDDESKKNSEETKEVSFLDKAKLFFTKKSKEKIEDVKKNAKKMASEKIKKKTKSEDSEENDEKHQEEQEKLFTKKTKMTLLQAEKKVKKWNEAGETKKVKAGVKMILEFFPNHEFRKMNLSKNKSKKIEEIEEIEEGEEGQTKKRKKKSLFAKVASNPSHGFDVSPEFLEQNGLPQEADVNDDERVFGALSYFPLLSLFVLATRKDSEFAMYHAWQGFAILAIFLVSLPFFWIFSFIPGMHLLFYLFYIALFFISLYAGFLAWSGRYINIPGVSAFAMKLAGK